MEAEILSGMTIMSVEELEKAAEWFINQGVKRVFITLGPGGVFYRDEKEAGLFGARPGGIVSATGAGDAFSAAILYSHLQGFDIRKTAQTGTAAAAIAMESKSAVNSRMSAELLQKILENDL
ncbi:MAG: PfkB family carbohydrate kinase, partial [Eubacteriales bacterium]|nr:PfkB family carbohydrate kinase [Eubacteriales bacterium]